MESKPAPCVDMDQVVSIHDEGIRTLELELQIATPKTFAGFGKIESSFETAEVEIVTWPRPNWRPIEPGTGNEGGITGGEFEFYWSGDRMCAKNHAVDGHYVTGWFGDPASASDTATDVDRSRVLVREANYHPDGSQVFFPRDQQPFVALLALPGDDVTPEDFVAFYCDGSFGINIAPSVWHQPVFPLNDKSVFDDKQGRVHACVAIDFVREFQTYVSVPLRQPTT